MNKVGNKKFTQAMRGDNMHPRCTQKFACKMHPKICMQDASNKCALEISPSRIIVCPICFAQKCVIALYIGGLKGSTFTPLSW